MTRERDAKAPARASSPAVVVGEAPVDLAQGSDGALHPRLGGGPFNVARALARLDQPTTFIGRISTDRFGARLAEALAADGVELGAGLRDPRPTALAVAELDAQGQATYRFDVAGSAAEALTPEAATAALPPEASAVYVGGLGLVLEPLASASEAVVEARGGKLVFVDPNVRPAAIGDMAAYRARLDRVLKHADVLKVSDADLAALAPGRETEAAALALLERGPKLVLLTLGAAGAVALGAFGRLAAAAPVVAVVDTIGAGDAFSGAWIAWWLGTASDLGCADDVLGATTYATAAAAFSCEHAGAAALTRDQLKRRGW